MNRDAFDRARGDRPAWRIAAEVGIPAPYLSKIVQGKVNPGVLIARRIADVVGASLDELYPPATTTPDPPKPRRFRAIPGGAKGTPKRPATTAEAGRAGGLARAKKLTRAQLSEQGKYANKVRWSRAARANAMCGRHHPALRLIRGGAIRGASDAMQEAA